MSKKLLKYLTPIILIGVLFSCDIEEEVIPFPETGELTAQVAGEPLDISSTSAKLFVVSPDSTLEITATDTEGSILTIAFNSLDIKTYSTTGESNPEITFEYKKSIGSGVTFSEVGTYGTLKLAASDTLSQHITGTFSFETNNYTISNGAFNKLSYEVE